MKHHDAGLFQSPDDQDRLPWWEEEPPANEHRYNRAWNNVQFDEPDCNEED